MSDVPPLSDYLSKTTREKIHLSELIRMYKTGEDAIIQQINRISALEYIQYDASTQWVIIHPKLFANNRINVERRKFILSLGIALVSLILMNIILQSALAETYLLMRVLAFGLLTVAVSLLFYQFTRLFRISKEYEKVFAVGAVSLMIQGRGGAS